MTKNDVLRICDEFKDLVKSDLESKHFDLSEFEQELKDILDCILEMYRDSKED